MRNLILAAAAVGTLVAPTIAMASSGHKAAVKGTTVHVCLSHKKHHRLKARLAQKCRHGEKALTLHLAALQRQTVTTPQSTAAAAGTQSPAGAVVAAGAPSTQGPVAAAGAQEPVDVSSPFTRTYTGLKSGDGGDSGANWANDSYDTEFTVTPLSDGSYLVVKLINGTFTTIAGAPRPADHYGTTTQTGGVNGTFQGVETWTVSDPNGPANFDPTATPDLNGMNSNNDQNAAFTAAFFPNETYSLSNYHFVYHTASNGSWIDSNNQDNDTGNITG